MEKQHTTDRYKHPKGKLKDTGFLTREDFNGGPISLDEIESGLYLGNLTAATHMETLKSFRITHILTLDSIPLPKHITEATFLTTKYVHIADMLKADILHHLDVCVSFISDALDKAGNVLVHCYFGVSRSSSAVIAYIMNRHNVDYQQAFDLVRSKRRFVQPNVGFVDQLKLYRSMGCKIDPNYKKYKIYRLRLAGEQMRKAKILPQYFNNIIKPDPAITQENPEPIVYRCRKCRRALASRSHLLEHRNKSLASSHVLLNETTKTNKIMANSPSKQIVQPRLLEEITAQIRKVSLDSPSTAPVRGNAYDDGLNERWNATDSICRNVLFFEPIAWMKQVLHNTQGKLSCPKCEQKIGSFSWINGCQCPCGEEVSPAFYLIPSRVELSKAVQNVQTTI